MKDDAIKKFLEFVDSVIVMIKGIESGKVTTDEAIKSMEAIKKIYKVLSKITKRGK